MKRIISLMLTLAVALSLLVLPAGAASTPEEALGEVNIYSVGYSMNYLTVNGRVQTQSYTYFLYRNSAGETQEIPAYCVNPDQYSVPQTVPEGRASAIWRRRKRRTLKWWAWWLTCIPTAPWRSWGWPTSTRRFTPARLPCGAT